MQQVPLGRTDGAAALGWTRGRTLSLTPDESSGNSRSVQDVQQSTASLTEGVAAAGRACVRSPSRHCSFLHHPSVLPRTLRARRSLSSPPSPGPGFPFNFSADHVPHVLRLNATTDARHATHGSLFDSSSLSRATNGASRISYAIATFAFFGAPTHPLTRALALVVPTRDPRSFLTSSWHSAAAAAACIE